MVEQVVYFDTKHVKIFFCWTMQGKGYSWQIVIIITDMKALLCSLFTGPQEINNLD